MENTELPESRGNAQDDIEFLVSSWNRLDVLAEIADAPKTRNDLKERTEVARVTLSRILADLEDREWIRRNNDHYEATKTGRYVATELTRLVENLGTLDHLGEAVDWLDINQFEFDLRHLQEATVVTPTWDDFTAQTTTIIEQVEASTRIRGIGTGLDREFFHMVGEATTTGDLELELILVPAVVDVIPTESELARLFRDIVDSPRAAVYQYRGEDPLMMFGLFETEDGADDHVMVCGHHDDGAPPGTMQSTEPAVWSWAESYFDDRRAESEPVQMKVFTP
jgi:predicted transcriptional regulator